MFQQECFNTLGTAGHAVEIVAEQRNKGIGSKMRTAGELTNKKCADCINVSQLCHFGDLFRRTMPAAFRHWGIYEKVVSRTCVRIHLAVWAKRACRRQVQAFYPLR